MKMSRIEKRFNRRGALELLGALGASTVVSCGDTKGAPQPSAADGAGTGLVDPMGLPLD